MDYGDVRGAMVDALKFALPLLTAQRDNWSGRPQCKVVAWITATCAGVMVDGGGAEWSRRRSMVLPIGVKVHIV